MIRLHGFPFSNYHNIVKHVLMHKGIAFEEEIAYPGSDALLAVNPLGKVPAMTTESGDQLSESSALVEYLEDRYPEVALLPAEPEARARVRRLMRLAELYFDLTARRLMPALFGNAELPEMVVADARQGLERGVTGLTALARFSPYLDGPQMTLADIYLRYALAIPKIAGPRLLDWDVLAAVPGLREWDALMADSDVARQIDADQKADTERFMAYLASKNRE